MLSLAYAQIFAYEHVLKGNVTDKEGHISNISGFVNIENQGVVFSTKNVPIKRLKYIPSRASHNKLDGHDDLPDVWKTEGKWKAFPNAEGRSYEVGVDVLTKALNPAFLEQVKRVGARRTHLFVSVTPGADKVRGEYPFDITDQPKLKYVQQEKTRTCLTTSFANCLYYCNCRDHGGQVYNQQKLCSKINAIPLFKKILSKLSINLKSQSIENLEMSHLKTKL